MRPLRRLLRSTALALGCLLLIGSFFVALAWWLFPFPVELLESPGPSPQVRDRHGVLLAERVGADEQFCRPVDLDRLSPALVDATVAVEDQRFFRHRGVDPVAIVRATGQNLWAGEVVSGASTITTQVVRLLEPRPRTLRSKLIEAFRALQLERRLDKQSILELYFAHSSFGGNLRGVESASEAYFGRPAAELSVGEAALLAGLPQSPSRLDPRRNPEQARERQREVLRRMLMEGSLAEEDYLEAARAVHRRFAVTRPAGLAFHAVQAALAQRPMGGELALDATLQREVEARVAAHPLPPECDVAVVVVDVRDGSVLASVGSADPLDPVDGQVDGSRARRSPGSTLKPFVYALAFEDRRLRPDSPVDDVPIQRGSWSPRNFDGDYLGELSAAEALRRSRNVPAILVAEAVGLPRLVQRLRRLGLEIAEDADRRRGLAVVTGAVEVSLRALTNAYATLARDGRWLPLRDFLDEPVPEARPVLEPRVCHALAEVLGSHARRPVGFEGVEPEAVPWFLWKTGTSSARRDAWAVGHDGRTAIGVWVGRFRGTGHSELVGRRAAEPLLAQLFAIPQLPPPRRPSAAYWTVRRPIPRAADGDALVILDPAPGAVLIAPEGSIELRPVVQGLQARAHWFVDGRHVEHALRPSLRLGPGAHEIRCVSESGAAAAVSLEVREGRPRR